MLPAFFLPINASFRGKKSFAQILLQARFYYIAVLVFIFHCPTATRNPGAMILEAPRIRDLHMRWKAVYKPARAVATAFPNALITAHQLLLLFSLLA